VVLNWWYRKGTGGGPKHDIAFRVVPKWTGTETDLPVVPKWSGTERDLPPNRVPPPGGGNDRLNRLTTLCVPKCDPTSPESYSYRLQTISLFEWNLVHGILLAIFNKHTGLHNFYRAKCSVARYCHDKLSVRPFVCPSVTLVDCDYTRKNSAKIISRLISLGTILEKRERGRIQGPSKLFGYPLLSQKRVKQSYGLQIF